MSGNQRANKWEKEGLRRIELEKSGVGKRKDPYSIKRHKRNGSSITGRGPQDFERDYELEKHTSALEKAASNEADLFLDTNILLGPASRESPLKDIKHVAPNIDESRYIKPLKIITKALDDLARFYDRFLQRPNVYVTVDVKKEVEKYMEINIEKITCCIRDKTTAERLTRPLKMLQSSVELNNERLKESGIEKDPVIERIYGLLPEIIPTQPTVDNPSETDRKLIVIPFVSGMLDGRKKVVVSNDRGVNSALICLVNILREKPDALDLRDFGFFRDFSIKVAGFERENRIYNLRTKSSFKISYR